MNHGHAILYSLSLIEPDMAATMYFKVIAPKASTHDALPCTHPVAPMIRTPRTSPAQPSSARPDRASLTRHPHMPPLHATPGRPKHCRHFRVHGPGRTPRAGPRLGAFGSLLAESKRPTTAPVIRPIRLRIRDRQLQTQCAWAMPFATLSTHSVPGGERTRLSGQW